VTHEVEEGAKARDERVVRALALSRGPSTDSLATIRPANGNV